MLTRNQGQRLKQDGERFHRARNAHYSEMHREAVAKAEGSKKNKQGFMARRENEIRAAVRRVQLRKEGRL